LTNTGIKSVILKNRLSKLWIHFFRNFFRPHDACQWKISEGQKLKSCNAIYEFSVNIHTFTRSTTLSQWKVYEGIFFAQPHSKIGLVVRRCFLPVRSIGQRTLKIESAAGMIPGMIHLAYASSGARRERMIPENTRLTVKQGRDAGTVPE